VANVGRELISKIIEEDDIIYAMQSGIQVGWFEDQDQRRAYKWMLEYFSRYGKTPTQKALKREFPTYRFIAVDEPFEYYVDQFRAQRRVAILVDTIVNADAALKDDDPKRSESELVKGIMQLGQEITLLKDENAVLTLDDRYANYVEAREHVGELTGIGTGYPTLDYVSGGYHEQQFVVIGGEPKQGKSFILLKSAMGAQEMGYKVLFFSFEMSVYEQLCRYDAMLCGVNSSRLLRGTAKDHEVKLVKSGFRMARNLAPFIVTADISASTTLSGLAGKIEQHQPDIIFIDGAYLMENEIGAEPLSAQAFTSISRGLKRLAQRLNKPIVITTQALSSKMKDSRVTMHSLGWSSAWAQDADLILGVERKTDSDEITLRVVAGRQVSPREIRLDADWETSSFLEAPIEDDDEYR
jgi:replicative DNA helicase